MLVLPLLPCPSWKMTPGGFPALWVCPWLQQHLGELQVPGVPPAPWHGCTSQPGLAEQGILPNPGAEERGPALQGWQ